MTAMEKHVRTNRPRAPLPAPIKLTDAAAERVKALIAKSDKPVAGLRIGVKSRGCSGLSYFVEYADAKKPLEETVQDKGVTIFIDPAAIMFLIGSQMDYVEDKFNSGFVFTNPNEKGRCGCGESFHV
jgi:iron-sulfur cluster assembly accessory protein